MGFDNLGRKDGKTSAEKNYFDQGELREPYLML